MGREDYHRKKKSKHHHGKSKKHKHKHKKKRRRPRRRRAVAPVGLPSIPTIEQNQYWLLHGRIANLEAQGLQQQGGPVAASEKRMSRAEEVDIANRVIDENLKVSRERDANRAARVQQDAIAEQSPQAGGDDQDEYDVNALAGQEHLNDRLAPPASPEETEEVREARLARRSAAFLYPVFLEEAPRPEPEPGEVQLQRAHAMGERRLGLVFEGFKDVVKEKVKEKQRQRAIVDAAQGQTTGRGHERTSSEEAVADRYHYAYQGAGSAYEQLSAELRARYAKDLRPGHASEVVRTLSGIKEEDP